MYPKEVTNLYAKLASKFSKIEVVLKFCYALQYGNTQTNIVIVQLSSLVQTRADFIYNLTCTILPPDDATVKSGYIGANHIQHPVPIEYLPAQHKLKAQVRLIIEHKV